MFPTNLIIVKPFFCLANEDKYKNSSIFIMREKCMYEHLTHAQSCEA